MRIGLQDQIVWITGGNEGIGRAAAMEVSQAGAKVAISGRDQEKLDEVVDEIQQLGGEALAIQADVTDPEASEEAVRTIIDRWGRLDGVCANAGINGTWAPIEDLTPEEWRKTIDVNLTGTFLTLRAAVPEMKKAGKGSMVVISSVNGTRIFSNEGASAYASSKAGQLALMQMLAVELGPFKIRVNAICPGAIDTGIQEKTKKKNLEKIDQHVEYPEGNIPLTGVEMGKPKQVAELILFLLSDAASHITGTPVWIDGAQSLLQG